MATLCSSEQPPTWERFTLLDILLLQAGFGIGCSVAFVPLQGQAWESAAFGLVHRSILAALVGAAVAGPIILLVQRVFRGRRGRLSAGEWLWLSPLGVGLLAAISVVVLLLFAGFGQVSLGEDALGGLVLAAILLTTLVIFLEAICALAGLAILLAALCGWRSAVPCVWTDLFGSATCFLIGMALFVLHVLG